MKCGILMIGSLFWSSDKARSDWRQQRLIVREAVRVAVPIRYGRMSKTWNCSYTMILSTMGSRNGQALLVPARKDVSDGNDVIAEAEALWKAEMPKAAPEELGKDWGCVGAWFRPQSKTTEIKEEWTKRFKAHTAGPQLPVTSDGILDITWSTLVDGDADGQLIDYDIILGVANKADDPPPDAKTIATRWLASGREEYFFNNVNSEIRTADDEGIWEELKKGAATSRWNSHMEAIKKLENG